MATANLRREGSSLKSREDRAVRIEDYLNDKLQTHADLESINSLLENVQNQQKLLRQQLLEAESTLEIANDASQSQRTALAKEAETFRKKQNAIDRRLMIVTQSETSDDAVQKFESIMQKLQRLDIAKAYVDLLATVDELSAEARKNFKESPRAALKPYLRLQTLANTLKQAQPAAEYAAPHLVDHVEKSASQLWDQMKASFSADFEKTLTKLKWPGKDVSVANCLEEWSNGVERLLQLQDPELTAREKQEWIKDNATDPLVLLPLEVMTRPLAMRFKYHFDGQKATNRLDRPEFFMDHILGLLNTYEEFFAIYLQPVLVRHFQGTAMALNPVYIDSTSALITALLPMLREKIISVLPQISKQPQLFSHFMHELMRFDASLKDDWGYDAGRSGEEWKGLTWEVLVKNDWFGKWLEVEKNFALSRYSSIIDAKESGEIDYDSVDPGVTKPTKAAIRVNDLLETITDRYRPLSSFSQKLRFLMDIQIAIFDKFHERLHSSLEAYLTMTSSLARTVQGVSKEEQAQLQGLGGLERLCRVYGSAEYLEKKMRDWSDDVFFLELWDELQFRARRNSDGSKGTVGKDLSVTDVANRTSSSVGSDEDTGALFDETAGAYRRLRVRTEGIMQDMLNYNMREALKPYSRINTWSSLSSDSATEALSVSAEIDTALQQLSSYLSFLQKALAEVALRRIARQLALAIQTYFWDSVLMRNNFSSAGIAQIGRDIKGVWEVIDRFVGAGQGVGGMRRLNEAVELLSLPTIGDKTGSPADSGTGTPLQQEKALGIWEVEKRIFRSNESAREVLEELGLEALSESDARSVLERRVELGS